MTPGRNATEIAAVWSPYQAQQVRAAEQVTGQRELLDADGRQSEPLATTDQPEKD